MLNLNGVLYSRFKDKLKMKRWYDLAVQKGSKTARRNILRAALF